MSAVEWADAERAARETGRYAIVGRADGHGSQHVVWVSRFATTAAYPPDGVCDHESWTSFEPLYTGEEVAAREATLAARLAAVEALADALTIAVWIERRANDHHAANLLEALQGDLRAALATGTTTNQEADQ